MLASLPPLPAPVGLSACGRFRFSYFHVVGRGGRARCVRHVAWFQARGQAARWVFLCPGLWRVDFLTPV